MRHRLPLLLIALLWLPLLASVWEPGAKPLLENRRLAPAPTLPHAWPDVQKFPKAAGDWATDHFGFRTRLLVAHNRLRFQFFGELPSNHLLRGQSGAIFMNYGTLENQRLIRQLCGIGIPETHIADRIADTLAFLFQMRALNPQSYLLVVPDKSRIYPDRLPPWVQRECGVAQPPVPTIVETIANLPGLDGSVFYPLETMRASPVPPYPERNFHWSTAGGQIVAQWVAETRFNRPAAFALPQITIRGYSDLTSFMPGLLLSTLETQPDFTGLNVLRCQNKAACFPEFPEAADKLEHVSRFRRDTALSDAQRRPRLLMLSNSFGTDLAPGFAPYFSEVWHFSMNGLNNRLTPAQREEMRHVAVDLFQPDIVLFVASEGTFLWDTDYFEAIRRFVTGQ